MELTPTDIVDSKLLIGLLASLCMTLLGLIWTLLKRILSGREADIEELQEEVAKLHDEILILKTEHKRNHPC